MHEGGPAKRLLQKRRTYLKMDRMREVCHDGGGEKYSEPSFTLKVGLTRFNGRFEKLFVHQDQVIN